MDPKYATTCHNTRDILCLISHLVLQTTVLLAFSHDHVILHDTDLFRPLCRLRGSSSAPTQVGTSLFIRLVPLHQHVLLASLLRFRPFLHVLSSPSFDVLTLAFAIRNASLFIQTGSSFSFPIFFRGQLHHVVVKPLLEALVLVLVVRNEL